MKWMGTTAQGDRIDLSNVVQVQLRWDADAPADEVQLRVARQGYLPLLRTVQGQLPGGQTAFWGIVDEQEAVLGGGEWVDIVARSRAALLLDNEAEPQTYRSPCLEALFEQHARPYGFTGILGNKRQFAGEYVVSQGKSEWEALANFCRRYLGADLIARGKLLDASGSAASEKPALRLGGAGDLCIQICYRQLPCQRISQVLVHAKGQQGYTSAVEDDQARRLGIVRRRLLNTGDDLLPAEQDAGRMLRQAKQSAVELELVYPGALLDWQLKSRVILDRSFQRLGWGIPTDKEWLLWGVQYRLDGGTGGEERTRLLLRLAG